MTHQDHRHGRDRRPRGRRPRRRGRVLEQQFIELVGSPQQPARAPRPSSASSNPLSGGGSSGSVVVGSANFPENELLAEVYALALQAKGVKATTKLNIGAREVYYPQVEKGAITIIPEYNGTLLIGRGRQDLRPRRPPRTSTPRSPPSCRPRSPC